MKKNILPILLLLLTALLSQSCMIKTNETEVAIKVLKFTLFGETGVQKNIYSPGQYHFYFPVITEMHKFDTKLQTMTMNFDRRKGDHNFRDDLLFKTIDGNDISLDVIIQYRIIPEMAHYVLQHVAKNDNELKETLIRTASRSKPRDIFGELTTEEFYNAAAREEKSTKAQAVLNEMLNPLGVTIEKVMTIDYRFNEAYQQAIEDKKIADQQTEKNKSSALAAVEEYKRKLEETQGDVNKVIAAVDGEFRKAKIEADAYYEKMKKISEAITAEGIAQAKGIAEMNKALAGTGGRTMVKLELAKALKNKKIMLLPLSSGGMNLKTTDVNDLLKVYGLKNLSKGKEKSSNNNQD
jgi:regulator of protease activity HflC (stomatin/prohibitin superfamily)